MKPIIFDGLVFDAENLTGHREKIGKAEWDMAERVIQSLEADSIPDTDYIRRVLQGFSDEFIELCCSQFVKGEMKAFVVTFGEEGEPS